MVAGINSANPTACNMLPMLGCDTPLNDVTQLDSIPSNMKEGLTVADLCPCGTCGNFFFVKCKFKFSAHLFCRIYITTFPFLKRKVLVRLFNEKLSHALKSLYSHHLFFFEHR